jgi:hypothetical protein
MTEGVVGMVMFAGSSREAWEILAAAFATTSFARSFVLRQQMAELKKRDMTVTVYFTKMKALADELASIGEPLRDAELISYILAGLPKEYDALYEVVNLRTPMPVRDLYAQLQATEHRQNSHRTDEIHYPAAHYSFAPGAYGAPTANIVAYGTPRGGGFRSSVRPPSAQTYQPKPQAAPGAMSSTGGRATIIC